MADVTPGTARMGWIPPESRTKKVVEACEAIVASMPTFFISGATESTAGKRVVLWDFAKKVLGQHIPTLRQMTGSCVGNGAENAGLYVQCVEIAKGDRERFEMLFLPYHYGRGRLRAGIRGRGEGSTGSGQAEAVRLDGYLSQEDPENADLPKPSGGPNALTWGGNVENEWSDGARINSKWIEKGRRHLIRSTAPVTTYEATRDAICNGYPVTVASMQGFQMRPVVDGGKAWGKPSGQWAHQMCFVGCDDDTRRPGCYCLNSWGADAHGQPAGDEPPGGFWVDAEIVSKMVRQNDSFAYSQFDGFPEQKLDFLLV